MKVVKAETSNIKYTAEGCEDLPATIIQFSNGKVAVETCFELDEVELKQVNETGKVYVTFLGKTIIPFMVQTISNVKAEKDTKINLCDTCKDCVPECNPEKIEFGDGIGNDNVIDCSKYIKK